MAKPVLHRIQIVLAIALGIPFIMIGLEHFIRPAPFDAIVPAYLGFPRFWTLASGVVEVLLGIGIDPYYLLIQNVGCQTGPASNTGNTVANI